MPVLFPAIVTGAAGFVGRALVPRLGAEAYLLKMAAANWREACEAAPLAGATIYHLAARVHGAAEAPEAQYIHDNAEKTRVLAQRAADSGARAFVFLSSIKVNGEQTQATAFTASDAPHPEDAYARSKLAAEKALAEIASRSRLRVAIVRAPLVYGAGAKGNLAALLRLADTPWPLPFASLDRPRSFIHVKDLCELLLKCGADDSLASGVYLAAHREPAGTATLVRLMRRELGRPPRLFPMAPATLEAAAALAGQGARARRLTRALVADPSATQRSLGWTARIGIEESVRDMVAAHRGAAA